METVVLPFGPGARGVGEPGAAVSGRDKRAKGKGTTMRIFVIYWKFVNLSAT